MNHLGPVRLMAISLSLILTGCGLSSQQKADYARVQERRDVSPAIYDKMVHGDPLGICDIEALSRAHVNSAIILRYLRDHDTVYYLSRRDVRHMKRAGVDCGVVDYMLLNATGTWWSPGPYPFFGADRFYGGPAFYGGYFSGFYYGGYGWGHHP